MILIVSVVFWAALFSFEHCVGILILSLSPVSLLYDCIYVFKMSCHVSDVTIDWQSTEMNEA